MPLAELEAMMPEAAAVAEVPFLAMALVFATGAEVMIPPAPALVALAIRELRAAESVMAGTR